VRLNDPLFTHDALICPQWFLPEIVIISGDCDKPGRDK